MFSTIKQAIVNLRLVNYNTSLVMEAVDQARTEKSGVYVQVRDGVVMWAEPSLDVAQGDVLVETEHRTIVGNYNWQM